MVDSSERNRSPEAEYFYKKEQELIAKLRQKAEAAARKKGIGEAVGVENEQILAVLDEMGYDRETVFLLFLIPLLQVAWSDGKLSEKERALILEVGHTYGVKEGRAAYQKLQGWLTSKPSKETFDRALTVIRDIMSFQTWEQREIAAQKLVEASERIAAASGGFLGLGSKVSAEEKAVLRRVAAAIETAHADTAPKLLDDIGS